MVRDNGGCGLLSAWALLLVAAVVVPTVVAFPYNASLEDWNLNQNSSATEALEYWGEWENHSYTPSPENWRMPTYAVSLDRYVNGDPSNDEANGTRFEHDWMSNQFRFGGDVVGLMNNLDYIHGIGIKVIYLIGSPFINQPWGADSYSPVDLTVIDPHHGTIDQWRELIDAIHERGMYIILDNTMSTMADLIGFQGSLNETAAFKWGEYDYVWKSDRRYIDFQPGDDVIDCDYPRMWDDDGYLLDINQTTCRDGEFDLYGDSANTGAVAVYQSQLGKYGSVQDRLREWRSGVLDKIKHFSCMQIAMLDIDGFRMDKALQSTIDALADFSDHQRQCAADYGKDNFYIVGEVIGTEALGAIYLGRGKQPDMYWDNFTEAALATNESDSDGSSYIRDFGKSALDGAGFHYTVYGGLTRLLGIDGESGKDGVDFVQFWKDSVLQNDLINANSGKFDPRQMYGAGNQDVFRWPSLDNGIHKQLLAQFITTLEMPGAPALYWGEEQAFYIIDSTASNYVYARQPMSSSRAWQLHGCYKLGDSSYGDDFPLGAALDGCSDDGVSLDHKDPSHPVRNIVKRMYEMRQQYPVLNDGYQLKTLSNQTYNVYLPESSGVPTPLGMWSIYRSQLDGVQDLDGTGDQGSQGVWLLYSNMNESTTFDFDCQNESAALVAPFEPGTTVKNLFYPYDEIVLENSSVTLDLDATTQNSGCLSNLTLESWEFKAYVPKENFTDPSPVITGIVPSHDERILSSVDYGSQQTVPIEIHFSKNMSCDSVAESLSVNSSTSDGTVATVNSSSIACTSMETAADTEYAGQPATLWKLTAELDNVSHGVHRLTVNNASTSNGTYTNSVDRFMFRVGASDNPVVFPHSANYSTSLLHRNSSTSDLYITQRASGADKFRYSRTWGSSWSEWADYTDSAVVLEDQPWSGTAKQAWDGEHIIVQYWSRMAGSGEHVQHGDLSDSQTVRRWPHAFVMGDWNTWGYDDGLQSAMSLKSSSSSKDNNSSAMWLFDLAAEFPTQLQINVWGMNADGSPDKTMQYGDVDGDMVLDWMHPDTLADNVINVTDGPGMPHVGWRIEVNDADYRFRLVAAGSASHQLALWVLLAVVPVVTGAFLVWAFKRSYYQVKFNQVGIVGASGGGVIARTRDWLRDVKTGAIIKKPDASLATGAATAHRRTVLIATMEYEIDDWNIKIKIGGLGKMASLMGSEALAHQNLIWVVPCVGGIDYPVDQPAEPMVVTINGQEYTVAVQYHVVRNITFVLLDAPVFRERTKADPYPPRMDDIESAVYYSAWNACIAETMRRFPIDLYHINDYHGALAPLYLLPDGGATVPVCLSLHNAEFQGMWSLRTEGEMAEVCAVFNLPREVVKTYVQFDKVFNMLYAGASYIRRHQGGFGAAGVSKKYGVRALKRYPIFWGLSDIGSLPNPDPDDMAEWNRGMLKEMSGADVVVDEEAERRRGELRVQAQRWAGLEEDPEAQLFVFVGRWSLQKGVDLIADVFPRVMERHRDVQLICIGPTIDNHGRFAALKLEKISQRFPGRVYSKPEFVSIPPFVFGGAEFALMPSRDEPFGLVAVEFGRKGALCVGSRVGGLGQMPGWWFTIESTETRHLLRQFGAAVEAALASSHETRRLMRARSLLQRFPVMQWVRDLERLQTESIQCHGTSSSAGSIIKQGASASRSTLNLLLNSMPRRSSAMATPITPRSPTATEPSSPFGTGSALPTPVPTAPQTEASSALPSRTGSRSNSRAPSPTPRQSSAATSTRNVPSFLSITPITHAGGPQSPGSPHTPSRVARKKSSYELGKMLASRLDDLAEMEKTQPQDFGGEGTKTSSEDGSNRPSKERSVEEAHARRSSSSSGNGNTIVDSATGSANFQLGNPSVLTLDTVVGDRRDFKLQNVEPFFNDPTGEYYDAYGRLLDSHRGNAGNLSSDGLCVEEYIRSAEKDWFARFYDAKLGKGIKSPVSVNMSSSPRDSTTSGTVVEGDNSPDNANGQFNLSSSYEPPRGLRRFMLIKIGDWPIYAFLLALGQIIAANSYQVTLLTGQNGQSATQVYVISGVYLAGSVFWWLVFRTFKLFIPLSLAFFFYGSAFFILAMIPFSNNGSSLTITAMQYAAASLYAVASSSGFLFFTQNFLTEGGNPVKSWMFRACTIQGTQQIYITALWYWGSYASSYQNSTGTSLISSSSRVVTYVGLPAALILWAIGAILLMGLPEPYRGRPGYVSAFYRSVLRRRIVVWFLVVAAIQNYFLTGPYGRSWSYLWNSSAAPAWSVAILVVVFFIFVWAGALAAMARLSREHSWALPLFAIGLGAPRWAQTLWGVSGAGLYLPWAGSGSAVAGALVGRGLWLWLGVLDALQGVGFGMILLQTLGRFHVSWTILGAQVIGSAATIAARASAPDSTGPGAVFPNLAMDLWGGVDNVWFWVPLLLQLLVCVGFFVFFRKEQLFKP